jgi:hypothetical protein
MNDFVIDDVAVHYSASKSADYRQRVDERFSTLIKFLQESGLTERQILSDDEKPSESLKIMKSDLTEIGFQVIKTAYDKWLRAIDRGKPISDTTPLTKALLKIRIQ